MSDYLTGQKTFAFGYDATLEIVTPDHQKIMLANSGTVDLNRPDKIRATRDGGFSSVEMLFDGQTLTVEHKDAKTYAQAAVPGTIDNVIEVLREDLVRSVEINGAGVGQHDLLVIGCDDFEWRHGECIAFMQPYACTVASRDLDQRSGAPAAAACADQATGCRRAARFDLCYTGARRYRQRKLAKRPVLFASSALQFTDNVSIARAVWAATAAAALGPHTRLANPRDERLALSGHDHALSPQRPASQWWGRTPFRSLAQLLHDVLPERGAALFHSDARRVARKPLETVAEPMIVPWGVRLLQMQLCLIYFQSCVRSSARGPSG